MTVVRRVAAVAFAVVGVVLPARPASAATEGPCPTSDGVTVVVDFASLGGGVVVRCAPGRPGTGFDALREAGFALTILNSGFLCRIDDRPGTDQEPCVDTPPPDAYWAYSYAPRGGQWNYSNEGGGSRQPLQGTVEGWRFSDGTRTEPGIDSPAAAAVIPPTVPRPAPTAPRPAPTSPTTRPAPSPTVVPGVPTTVAGAVPTTSTPPSTAPVEPGDGAGDDAAVLGATETASGASGPLAAGSRARALAENTTGAASARPVVVLGDDSGVLGSPAATGLGLAVVALVGIGAGVTHRRRRGSGGASGG